MRTMVDMGNHQGPLHVIDTPTSVDCTKDARIRRTLRSLVECMVPWCSLQPLTNSPTHNTTDASTTTTVTGTFYGYRRGRVSFCVQDDSRSSAPLLLLELAVPTSYLAREMQHGLLRVALKCDRGSTSPSSSSSGSPSLFAVPTWSMYCNGRKMGFAVRRQVNETDAAILRLMRSMSVGAGVLPCEGRSGGEGELMYLRAGFVRVAGSVDSESFHMINPNGSSGQELSVFLLRS